MRRLIFGLFGVLQATAAFAGGPEDGEAGLSALKRGAYDQAIQLFTNALGEVGMSGDDRELAYLSRAKAYVAKGQAALALVDLDAALRLKPDDSDALTTRQAALRQESGVTQASSLSSFNYTAIGATFSGTFQRTEDGWKEYNQDHPDGRHWTESASPTPGRIRLTDAVAIIEIEPSTSLIFYTDKTRSGYPVPAPIYRITAAR